MLLLVHQKRQSTTSSLIAATTATVDLVFENTFFEKRQKRLSSFKRRRKPKYQLRYHMNNKYKVGLIFQKNSLLKPCSMDIKSISSGVKLFFRVFLSETDCLTQTALLFTYSWGGEQIDSYLSKGINMKWNCYTCIRLSKFFKNSFRGI